MRYLSKIVDNGVDVDRLVFDVNDSGRIQLTIDQLSPGISICGVSNDIGKSGRAAYIRYSEYEAGLFQFVDKAGTMSGFPEVDYSSMWHIDSCGAELLFQGIGDALIVEVIGVVNLSGVKGSVVSWLCGGNLIVCSLYEFLKQLSVALGFNAMMYGDIFVTDATRSYCSYIKLKTGSSASVYFGSMFVGGE